MIESGIVDVDQNRKTIDSSCRGELATLAAAKLVLRTEAAPAPLHLGATSTFYDDYLCLLTMSFVPNPAQLSSQVTRPPRSHKAQVIGVVFQHRQLC